MKSLAFVINLMVIITFLGCGSGETVSDAAGELPEGFGPSLSIGSPPDVEAFAEEILRDVIISQTAIFDGLFDIERSIDTNSRWLITYDDLSLTGEDGGTTRSAGELESQIVNKNSAALSCPVSTTYSSYRSGNSYTLDGTSDWSMSGFMSSLDTEEVSFDVTYSSAGALSISGLYGAAVSYSIRSVIEGDGISTFFERLENYQSAGVTGTIEVVSGGASTQCSIYGNLGVIAVRCQ